MVKPAIDQHTKAELIEIAKEEFGITLTDDVLKKDMIRMIREAKEGAAPGVITAPKKETSPEPSMSHNENNIMVSPHPNLKKKEVVEEPEPYEDVSKVAIYSKGNVYWKGVGRLEAGYNFVTPDEAEQWLTRRNVRKATPEEVARHFNI